MLVNKIDFHLVFFVEEDLLDLLSICSNALVQMKVQKYHEMDIATAKTFSDLIGESDYSNLETGLTQSEWAQLAHWIAQELQFRYNQENT